MQIRQWYMHGVENDPNYHLYSKFSNFEFYFSCVDWLKWPSQNQENGGSFIEIGSLLTKFTVYAPASFQYNGRFWVPGGYLFM